MIELEKVRLRRRGRKVGMYGSTTIRMWTERPVTVVGGDRLMMSHGLRVMDGLPFTGVERVENDSYIHEKMWVEGVADGPVTTWFKTMGRKGQLAHQYVNDDKGYGYDAACLYAYKGFWDN